MKRIKRSILAAVAIWLLLLFLYPPYMCIDPETDGRVHAALGHYPIWNPPSPGHAFRALYPNMRELPHAERLANFVPGINRVRLMAYALAVGLGGGFTLSMLRMRNRRILRQKEQAARNVDNS